MTNHSLPSVTIILDGEFGDRLELLDVDPVWIVDSPTNASVVHRIRREGSSRNISMFRDNPAVSSSQALAEILPVIDLHHGPYSQSPPYGQIRVIGCRINQDSRLALEDHDFDLTEITGDGFVATLRSVEPEPEADSTL